MRDLALLHSVSSNYSTDSTSRPLEQGRTWVDHFGELTVVNLTNNMVCDLVFEQCGWFGCAPP